MMRLFMTAALLVSPVSASAAQPEQRLPTGDPEMLLDVADSECEEDLFRAVRSRNRAGVTKLGELPPGDTYLAVERRVDGCLKPLLAREYPTQQPEAHEEAPAAAENPEQPL